MTRDEVIQIVMVLTYTFDNFHPDDLTALVDTWTAILADEDAKAIEQAVIIYCKSNHEFAPKPGQLIEMAKPKPEYMSEMEAWSLVRRAISNGYYGAEQEFEKLPPEIQKVLGGPSQLRTWAVDENFNENVAMSNFQRSYRTVLQRAEDERLRIATSGTRLMIGGEK